MDAEATFNSLVGDLDTFRVAGDAERGTSAGEFTFHRAKRIDAGHPA